MRIGGYRGRIRQNRIFPETMRIGASHAGDLIVAVIDGQDGFAPHPNLGFGLVVHRKPEPRDLGPAIFNLSMADPKGWVLGGFALQAHNREISGVHPKFSSVKIFVLTLRAYGQKIEVPTWG